MTFSAALRAGLGGNFTAENPRHFHGHNTSRNGDEGIAENHHHRRQRLAKDGLGRNVAISDRGQGNDCPVDAARNAGEAIGPALDDIHQRAEEDHQGQYRVDKNGNLSATRPQRLHEESCLPEIGDQLQDTEDAQDAQNSDDQQVLASRQE